MFIDDAYAHLYSLCLEGAGTSSPNPNVAAAVYNPSGQLIADGFHNRKISPDHAEVVALQKSGDATRGSTLVVSLEPCNHQGTTPPCTQAIIDAGIAKVIFAVRDPNPIASGGMQTLVDAGIEVSFQPSDQLAFAQRAWLHKIKTGLPLLIWKVASTLDGRVAASDGTSKWITGEKSRDDVQLLRSQSDAILVGTNTAIVDNPHLVPRGFKNRPVRIVLGERDVPTSHHLYDEQAKTIWIKSKSLSELSEVLVRGSFNQVLVEAGPTLGSALVKRKLISELVLYQAPKILGSGKPFIHDLGILTLEDHIELELLSFSSFDGDLKAHYRIKES